MLDALDGVSSRFDGSTPVDGGTEADQAVAVLRWLGHDPLDMSLAVGDRLLLSLAEQLTGASIELTAPCPTCGEINVIEIAAASVADHWPVSRWLGPGRGLREPTYGDLQGLPTDPEQAVGVLAARCAVGPVEVGDAVAALDGLDDSLCGPIETDCIECAAPILVDADVQHLALRRLRLVTERVEWEIHMLASSYRWDLGTIRDLPDARRRRLAQLIEAER